MVQYNAVLITTGAIKGTFRDKIYEKLSLKYLTDRRWSGKTCFLSQNNLRFATILSSNLSHSI